MTFVSHACQPFLVSVSLIFFSSHMMKISKPACSLYSSVIVSLLFVIWLLLNDVLVPSICQLCQNREREIRADTHTNTLTTLSHKAMDRASAIKQKIRNVTYVNTLYLTKGKKRTRQMFPFCERSQKCSIKNMSSQLYSMH